MSSRSSLRNLVLTPERIPTFFIVSRSPLVFASPRSHRTSQDRHRLLPDHHDSGPEASPPGTRPSPAASPRFLLRLPSPQFRRPRRAAPAAGEPEDADTDLTTRAAMSLTHVPKVTTPYGFRAVLAASPCTRRRESLFHRNKAATVTDTDLKDPADPPPGPGRPAVSLRSVEALGLQVMKELKRPAAAWKAQSSTPR